MSAVPGVLPAVPSGQLKLKARKCEKWQRLAAAPAQPDATPAQRAKKAKAEFKADYWCQRKGTLNMRPREHRVSRRALAAKYGSEKEAARRIDTLKSNFKLRNSPEHQARRAADEAAVREAAAILAARKKARNIDTAATTKYRQRFGFIPQRAAGNTQ